MHHPSNTSQWVTTGSCIHLASHGKLQATTVTMISFGSQSKLLELPCDWGKNLLECGDRVMTLIASKNKSVVGGVGVRDITYFKGQFEAASSVIPTKFEPQFVFRSRGRNNIYFTKMIPRLKCFSAHQNLRR